MQSGIESRIAYKHTDDVTKDSVVSFAYIAELHIFHHLIGIATYWGKQSYQ